MLLLPGLLWRLGYWHDYGLVQPHKQVPLIQSFLELSLLLHPLGFSLLQLLWQDRLDSCRRFHDVILSSRRHPHVAVTLRL